jgi:hypothetical protein
MSIVFDMHGDGSKDNLGRKGWRRDSCNHLKTELLATKLILNAAKALAESSITEIHAWCSAARGVSGAGILRVTKALHQHEGYNDALVHLTMRLDIAGGNNEKNVTNSLFASKFHLYITIISSEKSASGFRLQPTGLSYLPLSRDIEKNATPEADYARVAIPDAGTVASELTKSG